MARSRKPSRPTYYLPGTDEKIRVMTDRASRREELFHPDDGKPLDWTTALDRLGKYLEWEKQQHSRRKDSE